MSQTYPLITDPNWLMPRLQARDDEPSWVEETASLLNVGALEAIVLDEQRWLIYHRGEVLMHFVFAPHMALDDYAALLTCLHHTYSNHKAKIENIVPHHPAWLAGVLTRLGYTIAFERIEMELPL
jgi:hypothetical protein